MPTPNLALPTTPNGNTNISSAYNDAMQLLDALVYLSVLDKDLTAPPTTTLPDVGKRWIVGPAATGLWAGKDGQIAIATGADLWVFVAPFAGFKAWVVDEALDYKYDAGAWSIYTVAAAAPGWDDITGDPHDSPALDAVLDALDVEIDDLVDADSALDLRVAELETGTDVTALSIASGVCNLDCALGDYFTLSLTENVTSFTFSNLPAAGKAATKTIRIRQDATGGRTFAKPGSFKAVGGSDTDVQAAANAYTLLTLTSYDQGTRWEYVMQEAAA